MTATLRWGLVDGRTVGVVMGVAVGGADTGTLGRTDDTVGIGDSAPFPPNWYSVVPSFPTPTEAGVVDLLTSPSSFTGEDSDLLISDLLGVGDLLTSAVGTTGGDINLFTSPDDSEAAGGVVDLLTSERGATGSVGTYLLGSETVERGGSVGETL